MKQLPLIRASFALLLLLIGFVIGRSTHASRLLADCGADRWATTPTTVANAVTLPMVDVPGADLPDLPRYPGATRVEYRQSRTEQLLVTEVEYVSSAPLETVRDFYRNVFYTNRWSVADLGFYQGEWTFFVVMGAREAHVEVEVRGPLVEIELELSEPLNASLMD